MNNNQRSHEVPPGVTSLDEFRRVNDKGPENTGHGGGRGGGVGGGGDGTDMTNVTREELKDKLALSEAHTDTKFAELRGDIQQWRAEVLTAIGVLPTKRDVFNFYTTVIVIALALVAAIFAAVAITDARYVGFLARIPVTVQSVVPPGH